MIEVTMNFGTKKVKCTYLNGLPFPRIGEQILYDGELYEVVNIRHNVGRLVEEKTETPDVEIFTFKA